MNESMYIQDTSGPANMLSLLMGTVFVLAIFVFFFIVMWKFYVKAGRRGWEWLIPIYSVYTQVKIAGRPGWWTVLLFIPLVNIAVSIIIALDTAEAFKRSALFGIVGLFLFSPIGYAILAFGDDTYTQPVHES